MALSILNCAFSRSPSLSLLAAGFLCSVIGAKADVWLANNNFALADRTAITINTDESLMPAYKLRAKFLDGGLGFHAATSWNNDGLCLDALPAPGTYSVSLYSLQYDGSGTNLQSQGPATTVTVTILWGTPPYAPSYWNDGSTIQNNNLCYNYSTNTRTDTGAIPGWYYGATTGNWAAWGNYQGAAFGPGGWNSSRESICASNLVSSCINDGMELTTVSATSPTGKTKIALVMKPITPAIYAAVSWDYHFYRKDSNGMWSHKNGISAARNYDDSGNAISNPETCNRSSYTVFLNYFFVASDKVQGAGHATIY
jgi:hypothetical protein